MNNIIYNSGFYKPDSTIGLLYAPNEVLSPTYQLLAVSSSLYNYPVNGWYWFNTLESACIFFNLDINNYLPPTTN